MSIPDVQSIVDTRNLPIDWVGVRGIRHPVVLLGAHARQPSIGMFEMLVALPADQKGTHMSRFLCLLNEATPEIPFQGPRALFGQILSTLHAQKARLTLQSTWFFQKKAPVSGVPSLMDYDITWVVEGGHATALTTLVLAIPVTTLCPCSKKIADYGAHNQRSILELRLRLDPKVDPVDPDVLIPRVEALSSCPLYSVLKRPDEKWVTERAYDHPQFVEDLVRDVAMLLKSTPGLLGFSVGCENFESIHNHSAYAWLQHNMDTLA